VSDVVFTFRTRSAGDIYDLNGDANLLASLDFFPKRSTIGAVRINDISYESTRDTCSTATDTKVLSNFLLNLSDEVVFLTHFFCFLFCSPNSREKILFHGVMFDESFANIVE
jgi:hypothetical protein